MFRRNPFLTAAWRQLVLLNFQIDPALLARHVPRGTELDFYHGESYVSIVGFQFQQTSIMRLPAVGHQNFPEVNLRFYVRRKVDGQWRRGVVFLQEIVPRRAVTWIARTVYGENYITRPMKQYLEFIHELGWPRVAEYHWQTSGRWNRAGIRCLEREPAIPKRESLEEFIVEHYWGYTSAGKEQAREYQVEHPRWTILSAQNITWDCDPLPTFGPVFGPVLGIPHSAFLALGSEVSVNWSTKI